MRQLPILFILFLLVSFTGSAIAEGTDTLLITRCDSEDSCTDESMTVSWMQEILPVRGDGETIYSFQGPTFDESDLWNEAENINTRKVSEAIKGTAIRDILDSTGGMEPDEILTLIASDGYERSFAYETIYDPDWNTGLMILVWYSAEYGEGADYPEGMRLFFLTPDTVFGNCDMRESFDEDQWHYFMQDGIRFPSASGFAMRNIEKMKINPN